MRPIFFFGPRVSKIGNDLGKLRATLCVMILAKHGPSLLLPTMSTSVSSRSEMLLRSTLLKDELSKNTHRRRGSLSYIDSDDEQVISPHSLSPKQRRHFRSPSLPGPVQLTPHEQVLRARLEHVLEACRSQNQAEHRISKDKRASLPASASSRVFSWLWQDSSTSEEDEVGLNSITITFLILQG